MLEIVTKIYNQIASKAHIYQAIVERTHNVTTEEASKIISVELEMYQNRLNTYLSDPKNSSATITELQGANIFLDVMEAGLSFSLSFNYVYVSRMKGTGTAISYKVTKEGAIYLAQRANAIDHLTEAVIVWKGEPFNISNTADGHEIANHVQYFEGKPKFTLDQMQVGYVYVIYPNGDRELSRISGERLKELRSKSQNPAMYDDESFIETKIVKHALRSVRKKPFVGQMEIAATEQQIIHLPITETQPAIQAPPVINAPPPQQLTHNQGAQVLQNSMQQAQQFMAQPLQQQMGQLQPQQQFNPQPQYQPQQPQFNQPPQQNVNDPF